MFICLPRLNPDFVKFLTFLDEEFIKEEIDMFFCTGRRVENLSDIESI